MINATASSGLALYPEHGENAIELLSKAETAMYVAKKQGRDCVHLYEEGEMARENMGSQLSWKERIHTALEEDRFVLAFQAVAPTSGDPISRYEVLVRMKASDGSLHMPGNFIPVAEELGLIHQIDAVVVRKALRVLSTLAKKDNSISFSINLSGLSVGNPDMMHLIGSELDASGLDRSKVIFEVTESAAFQDIGRAMAFIAQIKSMGCRIALDDFGVGFSSFSYLKQLDADILKIDGSFIRDLHKDKHDQLFVKALVDVAKGMGMLTVGEFVENAQCFDIIREFGVDYAQGYFIGKPRIDLFTE
jgi:EAL domain-containing protein (putative c-di-GMP-specific phosphodiesterase class I)